MRQMIIFSIILILLLSSVSALIMPSRTITQPIITTNITETVEEPVKEELETYPQEDVEEEVVWVEKTRTYIEYYPEPTEDEYGVITPTERIETEYQTDSTDRYYYVKDVEEKVYEPLKSMETGGKEAATFAEKFGFYKYDIKMDKDANRTHIILYDNMGKISKEVIIDFETGEITDIDALIQVLMFEYSKQETETLREALEEIKRINELREDQREYLDKIREEQKGSIYSAMEEMIEQAREEQRDRMLELQVEKDKAFEAELAAAEAKQEEIEQKKEAAEESFFTSVMAAFKGLFSFEKEEETPTKGLKLEGEVKSGEYAKDLDVNVSGTIKVKEDFTYSKEQEIQDSFWTRIRNFVFRDNESKEKFTEAVKEPNITMYEGHERYGSGPDFDNESPTLGIKEQSGPAYLNASMDDAKIEPSSQEQQTTFWSRVKNFFAGKGESFNDLPEVDDED